MKTVQFLIILALILIIGCTPKIKQTNHFTSKSDTLVITTEKIKGFGLFPAGAAQIYFTDTIKRPSDYHVIFPENICDIKLDYKIVDFKALKFGQYRKGELDKSFILKDIAAHKIDTLIAPTTRDNSVCIMSGIKNKELIYILDENNNKDFRDDSIRTYQKMAWWSTTNLIKCKYNVFDGKKMIKDSSWVNIGSQRENELLFFVSHHLQSAFSIDTANFQIGVVDGQSNFSFDEPILALTSQYGTPKDTLLKQDLLIKGEYLKLMDQYYRFDNISNDGKFITLIKEKDFNSKVGTQIGMIAPDFKFKSIKGELMNSADLKTKPLLVANISGCTRKSYEMYQEIVKANRVEMNIIGIESGIKSDLGGTMIDVEDKYNLDVYNKYRNAYSSYNCYVISPEGRIIKKFDIFDWESNLPKNYYSRNDGTPLQTADQVLTVYQNPLSILNRKLLKQQKYILSINRIAFVYHKEIRKDSIINFYKFDSLEGDTIDTIVHPEFKIVYWQDPLYLYMNKKLPDFKLYDLKGIEFNSSQLLGKPTLLNFSSTYCGSCVAEIPNLNLLKKTYGDNVNFISIADVERNPGALKMYLQLYREFQYQILENTAENKKVLNMDRLPRNIFLDKDGIVRNIQVRCNYESSDSKTNYFMKIIDGLIVSSK